MRKVFFMIFIAVLSVLFTFTPEIASNAVKEALDMSLCSVIPSVFPFLVLSGITVKSGIINCFSKLFFPIAKLFNFTKNGASTFVLGNLCGFPVGAVTTAEMKKRRMISTKEAGILAAVSNNVSTGFAVAFAGSIVLKSKSLGFVIYACQFISAVVIALVTRKSRGKIYLNQTQPSDERKTDDPFIRAVNDAALASLNITAFVLFFSVITAYVKFFSDMMNIPSVISALTIVLLEISNGCNACSSLSFTFQIILISFAIGFSGISVICQSAVFLKKENIKVLPIFVIKLFQGLLTSALVIIYVKLFPRHIEAIVWEYGQFFDTSLFNKLSLTIIATYMCYFIKPHLNKRLDL